MHRLCATTCKHPCLNSGRSTSGIHASPRKKGEVLLLSQAQPTMVGIVPRPHYQSVYPAIPALSPHQPHHSINPRQFHTIPRPAQTPLPFNERSVSFENPANHQHPCLLMNALLVSHPSETLGVQLRASVPFLEKGDVLLLSQAQPTMVGIVPHSYYHRQFPLSLAKHYIHARPRKRGCSAAESSPANY